MSKKLSDHSLRAADKNLDLKNVYNIWHVIIVYETRPVCDIICSSVHNVLEEF